MKLSLYALNLGVDALNVDFHADTWIQQITIFKTVKSLGS